MIQGFNYHAGPEGRVVWGRPASAFSKGDVLYLDSTSSVSRIPETYASGVDIFGIAEASSNLSISNLVPVRIPDTGTDWLCSLNTALTSHVTPGVEGDILFGVPNGRQYFAPNSANSVRAVCIRGTAGDYALDQSVHSQVVVRLIHNGGTLEIS